MTIDLKDIDGAIVFSKNLPAEAEHKRDREYVRDQDRDLSLDAGAVQAPPTYFLTT